MEGMVVTVDDFDVSFVVVFRVLVVATVATCGGGGGYRVDYKPIRGAHASRIRP
jgi:hypothetical protein